tara:strand:+ start:313 stop:555 length:243 start_codon:yes stop_codon:yes gene_type:complete
MPRLKKPPANKSLGTTPMKRVIPKNTGVNTSTPTYLKPLKEVPELKKSSLIKFLKWCEENHEDLKLSKASVPVLASFALG